MIYCPLSRHQSRVSLFAISIFVLTVSTQGNAQTIKGSAGKMAPQLQMIFDQLPSEIRNHIDGVRRACKDANEDFKVRDLMQGVKIVDLNGGGLQGVMVDDETLCDAPIAGVNCSNRGCDLKIWQRVGSASWKKVFDEHLQRKVISLSGNRFKSMAISIYAGHPRCNPDPKLTYTSGQNCNVVVQYRNGGWVWTTPETKEPREIFQSTGEGQPLTGSQPPLGSSSFSTSRPPLVETRQNETRVVCVGRSTSPHRFESDDRNPACSFKWTLPSWEEKEPSLVDGSLMFQSCPRKCQLLVEVSNKPTVHTVRILSAKPVGTPNSYRGSCEGVLVYGRSATGRKDVAVELGPTNWVIIRDDGHNCTTGPSTTNKNAIRKCSNGGRCELTGITTGPDIEGSVSVFERIDSVRSVR